MKRIPKLSLVFLVVGALAAPVGGDALAASSTPSVKPSAVQPSQFLAVERFLQGKTAPCPAGDVTMPEAVDMALRHNPSLGSQEAQGQAFEEARKSARGPLGPSLAQRILLQSRNERQSRPPQAPLGQPQMAPTLGR